MTDTDLTALLDAFEVDELRMGDEGAFLPYAAEWQAIRAYIEADDPEPEGYYWGGLRDGEETNEHEAWRNRQDLKAAIVEALR